MLKRFGCVSPYSKGLTLTAALSIIALIGLGQNYTQSLVNRGEDGIAVSNQAAYWILGEDRWSVERFRLAYETSLYLTIFLLVLYPVVLLLELKSISMRKSSRA
ncbi:hypothetical protein [Paenibacillus tarimensis]|uniref:hypothetical protein n=1 Tax=Paenibacillus tarimensis TaxID=416012 RepID=UPI001F488724|nr:hypothetical protein [Paenibacillus tarimensis]MCF2943100.1 hypothetical protein [Paenibacillus tarimensis]